MSSWYLCRMELVRDHTQNSRQHSRSPGNAPVFKQVDDGEDIIFNLVEVVVVHAKVVA